MQHSLKTPLYTLKSKEVSDIDHRSVCPLFNLAFYSQFESVAAKVGWLAG